MNKLEELIKEHCPDGVEYKKLSKVASVERGKRVVREQLPKEGKYLVFQNSLTPLGFYNQCNYKANTTYVIGAGAAGDIGFSKNDFWAADDCFPIVCSSALNDRYAYHFLLSKQQIIYGKVRRGSIPRLSRQVIEDLEIPVPPIEVQREIVRILDNFTELTAELTTELTARKKQYEYYREQLLSYDESVIKVKIGEICDVFTGGESPQDCIKSNVPDTKHPYAVWGNGKDVYGYSGTYRIDKDAVVISSIGANTGSVYFHKAFFTPIIRLKVIVPKDASLDMRFLYHAMSATKIESKSSSVPNMNAAEIKALLLPLPKIEEQRRIAGILDKFEAICSGLNNGLPAEIEARKKQYEYYRDKLLSFKEN